MVTFMGLFVSASMWLHWFSFSIKQEHTDTAKSLTSQSQEKDLSSRRQQQQYSVMHIF